MNRIGPYGVRVVHGYGRFNEQVVYMLIRSDESGEIMVAYSGNREMMMGLAKRLNKRALAVKRDDEVRKPTLLREIARKVKEAKKDDQ